MRFDSVFRLLFIVYCIEAGLFLLVAPWSGGWNQLLLLAPLGIFRVWLSSAWVRGLVSGFGAVHLIWAAHDIDLVFRPGAALRAENSAPRRGQ